MTPAWPSVIIARNAGPEWFHAMGFNQAVFECKLAYDEHVEVYGEHTDKSYLIAHWPRHYSINSLIHRNSDYLRGYEGGVLLCEHALTFK